MEEVWKDVVGYEGYYMVSNLGRIKSMRFRHIKREKIMNASIRPDGYMSVGLSKDGVTKTRTVHRLVATAFLENPNNLEMINHKDENRSNNAVDNLEWCTRGYNQLYSLKLHPERKFGENFKKNGKHTSPRTVKGVAHTRVEPIIQKTLDGEFIRRFDDASQAGKELGLNNGLIYEAAIRNLKKKYNNRKHKKKCSAQGFVWEFDDCCKEDVEKRLFLYTSVKTQKSGREAVNRN